MIVKSNIAENKQIFKIAKGKIYLQKRTARQAIGF